MTSLAHKPKPPEDTASPMERESFPNISFNGAQAKKAGLSKLGIGDTAELHIKLKATALGEDHCSFDVISVNRSAKGESAEEKQEGKEGPKKPKNRVLSPKDSGLTDAYDED